MKAGVGCYWRRRRPIQRWGRKSLMVTVEMSSQLPQWLSGQHSQWLFLRNPWTGLQHTKPTAESIPHCTGCLSHLLKMDAAIDSLPHKQHISPPVEEREGILLQIRSPFVNIYKKGSPVFTLPLLAAPSDYRIILDFADPRIFLYAM